MAYVRDTESEVNYMYVLAWLIKAALIASTCGIIGYGIGKIGIDNLFD